MTDLNIEKTYSTPSVNFSCKTGIFKIEGRSIPENPAAFYDPVNQWLELYFQNPQSMTRLDIRLDYINSGSSKSIMYLLKVLKDYHDQGKSCQVNWYFEEDDESISDLGKHYKSLIRLPFNLVEMY
jgi:hypothetical protein